MPSSYPRAPDGGLVVDKFMRTPGVCMALLRVGVDLTSHVAHVCRLLRASRSVRRRVRVRRCVPS